MPDTLFIHVAQIAGAFQVAGGAGVRGDVGMQRRPVRCRTAGADMAGGAGCTGIVGDVVGRFGAERREPACGIEVALVAFIGRGEVACVFAYGLDAVMAARARGTRVVCEPCREPAHHLMAILAGVHPPDGSRGMAGRLADGYSVIVAARASPGDVVLVPGGEPADKIMAFVALIGGLGDRGMARRLADRRAAVVACGTGSGRYAVVVPACRQKGIGSVAVIACIGGFCAAAMAGRLALGDPVVVAARALSGYRRGMVVSGAQERGGVEVAAFAGGVGHEVLDGFGCCDDTFAKCMAAVTVSRGAFENPARMAGFACGYGVSASEREACRIMVEIAAGRFCFSHYLQRGHG